MTENKLKPCPFCGGPVELENTIDGRSWWGVVCRNTRNRGGTCAIQIRPSASKEAAIERWNMRAPVAGTRLCGLVQEAITWIESGGGPAVSLCADLRAALASAPVAHGITPAGMKEICPACGHQFACFHSPYIDELRALRAIAPVAGEARMPPGYRIKVVEGHGYRITAPSGSDWVAHSGTPAGDLIAALYAAPQAIASVRIGRATTKGGRVQSYAFEQTDLPDGEHALTVGAPQASEAVPIGLLATEHTGMRVDYSGLLKQARSALEHGETEPALAEMLRQLAGHLEELGQRWYAGDVAVVDELLQLYCVESEVRAALSAQPGAQKEQNDA